MLKNVLENNRICNHVGALVKKNSKNSKIIKIKIKYLELLIKLCY